MVKKIQLLMDDKNLTCSFQNKQINILWQYVIESQKLMDYRVQNNVKVEFYMVTFDGPHYHATK